MIYSQLKEVFVISKRVALVTSALFKRDFRKDVTEAVSCFLDGYGLKLSKEEGIGC